MVVFVTVLSSTLTITTQWRHKHAMLFLQNTKRRHYDDDIGFPFFLTKLH